MSQIGVPVPDGWGVFVALTGSALRERASLLGMKFAKRRGNVEVFMFRYALIALFAAISLSGLSADLSDEVALKLGDPDVRISLKLGDPDTRVTLKLGDVRGLKLGDPC